MGADMSDFEAWALVIGGAVVFVLVVATLVAVLRRG